MLPINSMGPALYHEDQTMKERKTKDQYPSEYICRNPKQNFSKYNPKTY